jgi:hypothetical protein
MIATANPGPGVRKRKPGSGSDRGNSCSRRKGLTQNAEEQTATGLPSAAAAAQPAAQLPMWNVDAGTDTACCSVAERENDPALVNGEMAQFGVTRQRDMNKIAASRCVM